MKSTVIAGIVAAAVASGTTYAATQISGKAIARHSIPADRLMEGAVAKFTKQPSAAAIAAAVTSQLYYQTTAIGIVTGSAGPTTYKVQCPPGMAAISGGYTLSGATAAVTEDAVTDDRKGWEVTLRNYAAQNLTLYAACEPSG